MLRAAPSGKFKFARNLDFERNLALIYRSNLIFSAPCVICTKEG
nr:MAG TPA: hypothetical protein [Caudoviricetes sp.]